MATMGAVVGLGPGNVHSVLKCHVPLRSEGGIIDVYSFEKSEFTNKLRVESIGPDEQKNRLQVKYYVFREVGIDEVSIRNRNRNRQGCLMILHGTESP